MKILLTIIKESPYCMRSVDRQSIEYQSLCDSIRQHGVVVPIIVSKYDDITYIIRKGHRRFTAALDVGLKKISAKVINCSDSEMLGLCLSLYTTTQQPKPIQYSYQIERILALNPTIVLSDFMNKYVVSERFVIDRLNLNKLNDTVLLLVESGTICLSNAYMLAKLPEQEQLAYQDRAIANSTEKFSPTVCQRLKELRDAKRKTKRK